MKYRLTILLAVLISKVCTAQIAVERNLNVELVEKDSATSAKIENSLSAFLSEAKNRDYSSEYVDTVHLNKYRFFFEKMAGIGKGSDSFNHPLILKSFPLEDGSFRVTVAFTGTRDSKPFVYQVTELKAVPYRNHFRFYCAFEDNTRNFKEKKIDNVTYHFSGNFNDRKANEFVRLVNDLSKLTGGPKPELDYYSFQSLDELLKSYGFLFSARQCNFLCYDLGFTDNKGRIYMTGTGNENYIFGYIGEYLYYNLPNREQMYWPFVQGVSAYYGGYGLSYDDMAELKKQFRDELAKNPEIDFLEEFKKGRKSDVNRHFSYYVMSAFLFEEALDKQGFDKAISLVYSGENGERFFENIKRVLDIEESDFHKTIVNLINKRI
ncbi:hypothetical protein FUAX_17250 [Fulvitalea axinellae]|uniref:Uncharacterized protein n=1 Tax=Fulvitalea axinellae TaxID=1182444 RepID=A0AAU9D009_9BACT|nr:hypothetical protein FUAX_17250 [Fulvitalea axinellae]